MNDFDLVSLQDTSGVPPRSRFLLRPMPADWDSNHPAWNRISEPAWLSTLLARRPFVPQLHL